MLMGRTGNERMPPIGAQTLRFPANSVAHFVAQLPKSTANNKTAPRGAVLKTFRNSKLAMGLVRIELTTSRLSGVRSNQLSYRPKRKK